MLSNATTVMDSVTSYNDYITRASELGMKAIAFTEHGNVLSWYAKKKACEEAGLKYIHGVEAYVTKTFDEKIRDNHHVVLLAKNYDGVRELNRLISMSFNRSDVKVIDDVERFYFNPRISYEELINTSDNIIILTACLAGILGAEDTKLKKDFIDFLVANKHRCFLEIQHHPVADQKKYNKALWGLSKKTGLELVAGTDTHNLNDQLAEGRIILQKAKNVRFDNEEGWDLTFKTYDELVRAYTAQGVLPEDVFLRAIENTNKIADMIETFELDYNFKYPKIYNNAEEVFYNKIQEKLKKHPCVLKRYDYDTVQKRINEEFEVFKQTQSIDFMLLQDYLRDWEKANNIYCGYSRGSVSGSLVAYILGITEMDSIRFNLNFFRFTNPQRVTVQDIDTDYSEEDREKVREFILRDKMGLPNLYTSEIVTFNTIALKGAIRDVGRALKMPLAEVDAMCKNIDNPQYEEEYRKKYPTLFKYVDILQGTITSIGVHPAGCLITEKNIFEEIGTITLATSKYPVSALNMNELDDLKYVKLDILGLDNVGVINETCKLAGIERRTPDNTDLDDMNVWRSIREDTTGIFQWESAMAENFLKKFMSDETLEKVKKHIPNFSMIKWFSFGNGLLRPACESFRDEVAEGKFYDNGLKELNEFLAPTMGRVVMQEDIMMFLVKFCGYSMAEADIVRRGIAKKKGTEQLLPEIEQRFIKYTSKNYGVDKAKCAEIIKPFLQVILSASDYAFSWNHSDSYSCIGYICGWLRYYYPLEFLTAALNIFEGNEEKTKRLTEYANKAGIKILPARFRHSTDKYTMDKSTNTIYKGVASIKHLNHDVARELYALRNNEYKHFYYLLVDLKEKTSMRSNQLDILVRLDFFDEFGKAQKLLNFISCFNTLYGKRQISKDKISDIFKPIVAKYSTETPKQYKDLDYEKILLELWDLIPDEDLPAYQKVIAQKEFLGYIDYTNPNLDKRYIMVLDLDTRYAPRFTGYCLNNGKTAVIKVYRQPKDKRNKSKDIVYYEDVPFKEGDILYAKRFEVKPKMKKEGDSFVEVEGEKEWWLVDYVVVDV